MSSSRILLVLGSGKNIGHHVAEVFRKAGYRIAVVSRSVQDGAVPDNGYLSIQRDLSDSASVPCIFETVKAKFGGPPSVIVYNAATVTFAYDETNPFSVPIEGLNLDNAVNNTSAYIAAREAVAGFETMSTETPKAFIYTGNLFAGKALPLPLSESLGISKSAASYWVGSASEFYKDRGYKFFYADERKADGHGVSLEELSGPGAGEFYIQLAEQSLDVPWYATFVTGNGFVQFPESSRR